MANPATVVAPAFPPLHERPVKNTICLFDVDGTLTPARLHIFPEMATLLSQLRSHVAVGFVGGSDLVKQQEQLSTPDTPVTSLFDFCFSENGLTAYRMGVPLASTSFIQWLGEDKYKKLMKFVMHYLADLEPPVKRGTFVEFRNGMINISPVGRQATTKERHEYQDWDLETKTRETFVARLREEFAEFGLTYSIGGEISFDVFPKGWDKTYCLRHVEAEAQRTGGDGVEYTTIHFFGDKTFKGGNDYEIYEDKRTIGHSVKNWQETAEVLRKLFPQLGGASELRLG